MEGDVSSNYGKYSQFNGAGIAADIPRQRDGRRLTNIAGVLWL